MLTSLTAASTVAACGAVRRRLNRPDRKDRTLARGWVRLTALWNRGAAFALPAPKQVLYGGAAASLLTALRLRKRSPIASGLILGGGLSNLAERLLRDKVYDYVQFPKAPGPVKRYVYNLADFAVFLGILTMLFRHSRKK